MINTNKIDVHLNMDKINKDFDVYRIEKTKGNYFSSNVLDMTYQDFKAVSVVYTQGTKWYALFHKGSLDTRELKEMFKKQDPESIVKLVDIYDEKNISKHILAMLLFNALKTINHTMYQYNNVSGSLYYFRQEFMEKTAKTFYALKLTMDKEFIVTLKVTTFTQLKEIKDKSLQSRNKYIFDSKNYAFRRFLRQDKELMDQCYILKSLNRNKKNKVDFLKFKSANEFDTCKVGVFACFL